MAELALMTEETNTYEDGDILCAFTDRHIQCVHAQHICHKKHASKDSSGLITPNSLTQEFLERVSQYRFERISKYEVSRVIIKTDARETLTGPEYVVTINGETPRYVSYIEIVAQQHTGFPPWKAAVLIAGGELGFATLTDKLVINGVERQYTVELVASEVMDVPLFVSRRMASAKKPMFGTVGKEIWYGGKTDCSQTVIDGVWEQIEERTLYRKNKHNLWPCGQRDTVDFFFVKTDAFDDAVATELTSQLTRDTGELDKNGLPIIEVVKKRKHKVKWDELPNMLKGKKDDIRNKGKSVDDRRKGSYQRSSIVVAKSLSAISK